MLSDLKCGSHVELLEFVRGLECLQVKTRRTVPFLIDMKIFYALLKMSFGASYAPWHVDQFLFGHPLLYGVWHPYKYSVEITYKAFAPIIKFLEQGWDLKAGAVVPMKVKLRHMEKTIVGTAAGMGWRAGGFGGVWEGGVLGGRPLAHRALGVWRLVLQLVLELC